MVVHRNYTLIRIVDSGSELMENADVKAAVSAARLNRDIEMLDVHIRDLSDLLLRLKDTRNRLADNADTVGRTFGL